MFKSSFTIGKISGIPIRLHISFLLILPFLAWAFGNNIQYIAQLANVSMGELSASPYVLGLILAVALFISVGLHELAHSYVARSKGVTINSITLMLFGGVAQMDELSEEPSDEAWMALAGPLFSLIFGLILVRAASILSNTVIPDVYLLVLYLGQMNVFLGIFNLLPAFPTDGGRIMRALIARKTSFVKATRISAAVGKGFAFLFGIVGLVSGNFILIFIGFFIFIGASREYQASMLKDVLSHYKVKELMTKDVKTVSQSLSVKELLDKMLEERHTGYPVVSISGELSGCVTMEDIQKITPEEHSQHTIKEIMSTDIKKVSPDDNIYDALKQISQEDIGRLMVMDGDELVGIITRTDIIKGYKLHLLQEEGETFHQSRPDVK